jgi:hypothetical protein
MAPIDVAIIDNKIVGEVTVLGSLIDENGVVCFVDNIPTIVARIE